MKLYLVTDEELLNGKDLYQTVEEAVKGGVTMVQLRQKESSTNNFVERALRLKQILKKYDVPLIINDRIDIALAIDADGVHIGQSDMPYKIARSILPKGKIIGLSVESPEQVIEANKLNPDYIAASPVFSTTTKTNTITEWGVDGIQWIKSVCRHPLIGIGNMNIDTIPAVIRAGADGVAVVSAIISSQNPQKAAKELSEAINRSFNNR